MMLEKNRAYCTLTYVYVYISKHVNAGSSLFSLMMDGVVVGKFGTFFPSSPSKQNSSAANGMGEWDWLQEGIPNPHRTIIRALLPD